MQFAIIIIFLVLLSLLGMRAWFMVKADKSGMLTFWEAVDQMIHEDEIENKKHQ